MKANSKILGILIVLLVVITVSAASAFDFNNFSINTPAGSNFTQQATTNLSIGDMAIDFVIFENSGNNSEDVSSIIYYRDSTSGSNMTSNMFNDLKKDNEVAEENGNYTIFKIKNSDLNLSDNLGPDSVDDLFNMVGEIFSGDANMNFSADGNSVSLSGNKLEISDASGENVSISPKGVNVSSVNDTNGSVNVTVDEDVNPAIHDDDYVAYLKNKDNTQVVLIAGDNLDLIKQMAGSAKFN